MIFEKCKSHTGDCPCLDCEKLVECESGCDTDTLCDRAREYCEGVNGDGREESNSILQKMRQKIKK
jgi:hypothetical protein